MFSWNRVGVNRLWLEASLVLSWQLTDYLWYSSWSQDKDLKKLEREEALLEYAHSVSEHEFNRRVLLDDIASRQREIERRRTLVEINEQRVREVNLLFERGTAGYDAVLNALKV